MATDIRKQPDQLSIIPRRLDKLISAYAQDAAWLAAIVVIVFTTGGVSAAGDMFWQQKAGEWILAHHAIPHQALFAPYAQGQPWVVQEWLSHVLLALTAHLSPAAPYLMMDSVVAASVVLTYLRARRFTKPVTAAVATLLVIIISMLSGFWTWRTWWWSMLLMQLELLVLEGHAADAKKPLWPLIPIMILWANLHTQVLFGVILLGLYAVTVASKNGKSIRNRDWAWCAAAALVTLINPNGIHELTYPFEHMTSNAINSVVEWLSVNTHRLDGKIVVATIALSAVLLVRSKRNVPLFTWLMFAGFAALSLYEVRNTLTYLFAVIPQVAALYSDDKTATRKKALTHVVSAKFRDAIAILTFVIAVGLLPILASKTAANAAATQTDTFPKDAVTWLKAHPMNGPLLNNYTWGGYLIYCGIPVFIDGRADIYFNNGVFDDYMDIWNIRADTPKLLEKYGFTHAILPPNSPLTTYLKGAGWNQVYADATAAILQKP